MLFFLLLSTGCEGKARIFFVFHPASGIFKNLFINCVCAVLIFRCYLYMYIFSNVLHASLFFVLFFFDVHTILFNVFMWCVFFAGSFEKRSVGFYSCVYSVLFLEAMSLKRKKMDPIYMNAQ